MPDGNPDLPRNDSSLTSSTADNATSPADADSKPLDTADASANREWSPADVDAADVAKQAAAELPERTPDIHVVDIAAFVARVEAQAAAYAAAAKRAEAAEGSPVDTQLNPFAINAKRRSSASQGALSTSGSSSGSSERSAQQQDADSGNDAIANSTRRASLSVQQRRNKNSQRMARHEDRVRKRTKQLLAKEDRITGASESHQRQPITGQAVATADEQEQEHLPLRAADGTHRPAARRRDVQDESCEDADVENSNVAATGADSAAASTGVEGPLHALQAALVVTGFEERDKLAPMTRSGHQHAPRFVRSTAQRAAELNAALPLLQAR